MRTDQLSGAALDWAVGRVVYPSGMPPERHFGLVQQGHAMVLRGYHPSTDWALGGPLIERYGIGLLRNGKLMYSDDEKRWRASCVLGHDSPPPRAGLDAKGATPLVAAMRCLVYSRLGEEVEVPEELLIK